MPPRQPYSFRHTGIRSIAFVLRVAEPLLVMALSAATFFLRQGAESFPLPAGMVGSTLLATLLFAFCGGTLKLYRPSSIRSLLVAAPRLIVALSLAFGTLVTVLFLMKNSSDYSRIWLILWFATSFISLLLLRGYVSASVSRRIAKGEWARKVAILGTDDKAENLLRVMAKSSDITVVGVYASSDKPDVSKLSALLKKHFQGNFLTLLEHALRGSIDDIILTEGLEDTKATIHIINRLNARPVNVMYCLPLSLVNQTGMGGLPLVTISRKPLEGHSVWLKRMLDIAASGFFLLLLAPVMGVLAVLVKMSSPGPVFFRQKRGGFNGEDFEMMKFRSMRVGAAAMQDASGKEKQAQKDDPRITPIGRFLRKSSLDELPQLINVLRGDMSLVGPRPHVPSHNTYYETLIDTYASRHRMKPGITGWAQLNGWRGETETLEKMAKRVEFDIWYTQNWSLWLDVKIIVLTPFVALFQKGAY